MVTEILNNKHILKMEGGVLDVNAGIMNKKKTCDVYLFYNFLQARLFMKAHQSYQPEAQSYPATEKSSIIP